MPNDGRPGEHRDAPWSTRRSTRREFARDGAIAAGALALGAVGLRDASSTTAATLVRPPISPRPTRRSARPNVLVIIVDEMRAPRWFPPTAMLDLLLPNIASIRRDAVSFERHFAASNNCTPSRSAATVTGLYSHQTGCLVTGRSELDSGFPTWGTLLREPRLSRPTWWGKWHLSNTPTLEPWGFAGGTFPSPNGGPGQGAHVDPGIASQFEGWLAEAGGNGPWCTTVSFVNPHDIVWWWTYTRHMRAEDAAPRIFSSLPGNFETPAQLIERAKPRLQLSLQDVTAAGFGAVPFTGNEAVQRWSEQRDLYLKLQRDVDIQVGRVLTALARAPAVERNTVVIFTSDHGEYGGSHGLRGKGAAVYDEGIQVPLFVKDPRGELARLPRIPRQQLTSSVDIVPLLLTIATGSADWRRDPGYSYLARRADLAAICADPNVPGRPWIAHATDEVATEFCPQPYPASAPCHVVAVRTDRAKYAIYSNWRPGTFDTQSVGDDGELYDYSTASGRLELANDRGRSAIEAELRGLLLDRVVPNELRAPLPRRLQITQERAHANYQEIARTVSAEAGRDLARRLAEQQRIATQDPLPDWYPEPFPAHRFRRSTHGWRWISAPRAHPERPGR